MNQKIILQRESEFAFESQGKQYLLIARDNGITIQGRVHGIYGLGERFNSVNHRGQRYENKVEEHFCNQGMKTYFPLPFFYTDEGFGIFINTPYVMEFDFTSGIEINFSEHLFPLEVILFKGLPAQMVAEFGELTGTPLCPPKWALGPWISAHRWNSSEIISEQLTALKDYGIPATVMVIEQWSDEATFYVFNGAEYEPKNAPLKYEDFTYDENGPWPDPKKTIEEIHNKGLKVLLWQCPVIKKLSADEPLNLQHEIDQQEVVDQKYIPINSDGTPYTIPDGHWFPGSMVPDFTNPKARKWWFDKRRYLLDIGVDGFKTDGGEFIYSDDIIFDDGSKGVEMVNQYSVEYVKSYTEFCGKDRVIFSRAGYIGQQQYPIQWAGDQESTWSELRSVLNAGLSAAASGQIFWGFDIGGFSGELPSVELYKRSVQFAVFTPIMQVHSEPIGGQFAGMRPTKKFINDRTPWNMAAFFEDEDLIRDVGYYFNCRMNLLPTIYCEALKAIKNKQPLMKHGLLVYPNDQTFVYIDDQYFFGDILVAPVLNPGQLSRRVYFPEGDWFNLFTKEVVQGGGFVELEAGVNDLLTFVPKGTALVLNLGIKGELGGYVGNNVNYEKPLTICMYGEVGSYTYIDEIGNDFIISWENHEVNISGTKVSEFFFEFVQGGNR